MLEDDSFSIYKIYKSKKWVFRMITYLFCLRFLFESNNIKININYYFILNGFNQINVNNVGVLIEKRLKKEIRGIFLRLHFNGIMKEVGCQQDHKKEEIFLQIVIGVKQFHKLSSCQTQNFMIGEDNKLNLIDFVIIKDNRSTNYTQTIWTFYYTALEVFNSDDQDSSNDI